MLRQNLPELQARIAALTTTEYEQVFKSQSWTRRVDAVYGQLEALLREEYVSLAELLPSFSRDRQGGVWPDLLKRPANPRYGEVGRSPMRYGRLATRGWQYLQSAARYGIQTAP
jgi:hypothetical protein